VLYAILITMHRYIIIILILLQNQITLAQKNANGIHLTTIDSSFLKKQSPTKFKLGHFFKTDNLYAILLSEFMSNDSTKTYFNLKFFEKTENLWTKKNEYDSLETDGILEDRFANYNKDKLPDYLIKAGIIGTGGNETEYLFLFDTSSRSLVLVKGFENIPSTSFDRKRGVITSIGLSAGIPSTEYYKIYNYRPVEIGGKDIWTDSDYAYLERYRIKNGKKIVFQKERKKLPFDMYAW
jgi:hypothetical protein